MVGVVSSLCWDWCALRRFLSGGEKTTGARPVGRSGGDLVAGGPRSPAALSLSDTVLLPYLDRRAFLVVSPCGKNGRT